MLVIANTRHTKNCSIIILDHKTVLSLLNYSAVDCFMHIKRNFDVSIYRLLDFQGPRITVQCRFSIFLGDGQRTNCAQHFVTVTNKTDSNIL